MKKFRIDAANQNTAIIDLLVQVLANQHMFIEAALSEFAEKNNKDLPELTKRFEKGCETYRDLLSDYLLENFGRLDVDDLIE